MHVTVAGVLFSSWCCKERAYVHYGPYIKILLPTCNPLYKLWQMKKKVQSTMYIGCWCEAYFEFFFLSLHFAFLVSSSCSLIVYDPPLPSQARSIKNHKLICTGKNHKQLHQNGLYSSVVPETFLSLNLPEVLSTLLFLKSPVLTATHRCWILFDNICSFPKQMWLSN